MAKDKLKVKVEDKVKSKLPSEVKVAKQAKKGAIGGFQAAKAAYAANPTAANRAALDRAKQAKKGARKGLRGIKRTYGIGG